VASARGMAVISGLLVTCSCVFLTAGCGGSPTEPDDSVAVIRGEVTDRVGRPVEGALVAALDGRLAGTTVVTSASGRFELTGASGAPVTVRVSRDGFRTRTQALVPEATGGRQMLYVPVWLETVQPPVGLEPGDYTLTFAFDLATARDYNSKAGCEGYPPDLASRSYSVTIVESPTPTSAYNRWVKLDPEPNQWRNIFAFAVAGASVALAWDEMFFEELSGARYVRVGGSEHAVEGATAMGASISLPFAGAFEYCQTRSYTSRDCWHEPAEQIVTYRACRADQARMVFTKR
jgi:Carboxypeptidase regulatory-like domain